MLWNSIKRKNAPTKYQTFHWCCLFMGVPERDVMRDPQELTAGLSVRPQA
jgi:hypothetical protein